MKISRDSLKHIRQLALETGLTEKQVFDDLLLIGFRAAPQLYGQLIEFRKELNVRDTPEASKNGGATLEPPEAPEPIQPLPDEPDEDAVALGVSDDEAGHFTRPGDDTLGSGLDQEPESDRLFAEQDLRE